jgi:hypothetical protein
VRRPDEDAVVHARWERMDIAVQTWKASGDCVLSRQESGAPHPTEIQRHDGQDTTDPSTWAAELCGSASFGRAGSNSLPNCLLERRLSCRRFGHAQGPAASSAAARWANISRPGPFRDGGIRGTSK